MREDAQGGQVYGWGQFAILMSVRDMSLYRIALFLFLTCGLAWPQEQPLTQSPANLVRETVDNEIKANNGGQKFMFRDRKQTQHGSQTRLIVETQGATAGMLVAVDDHRLSTEQVQQEQARLNGLVNNPDDLKKKEKAEREDARRTERIVRALPDAFIFQADGTEPGRTGLGAPGDELIRLKFQPKPNYVPPSHAEQVLTGMQGYVLIDANKHRIAKIDGTLFKEVGFGWGILGRLDKGGHFLVEQGCVGDNDWEVTRMSLAFTGKELLFKSIFINFDEVMTDFHRAPSNLTFAQAVELLKKQSAELAENRTTPDQAKLDSK
jgi:hypothetical protein